MISLVERLVRLLCEFFVELDSRNVNIGVGCEVLKSCRAFLDNKTEPVPVEDISRASKTVLLVLYSVTLVVASLGNLLVLMIFLCNKQVRHTTNACLVSLAVSDLLITICTIPFSIFTIFRTSWSKDIQSFTCKVVPYVQSVAATATVLTLCCICAERYLAIVYPLRARAITARQRLLGLLVGVWLLSLVAAVPHAIWHTFVSIPAFLVKPKPTTDQCTSSGPPGLLPTLYPTDLFPEVDLEKLPVTASLSQHSAGVSVCFVLEEHRGLYVVYKWVFLVLLFILPTLFMIGAYVRVGWRLWDRRRPGSQCGHIQPYKKPEAGRTTLSTASSSSSGGAEAGDAADRKKCTAGDLRTRMARRVTLMLVMAMALFVVCWLPYLLFEAVALSTNLTTTAGLLNVRYYLEWLSVSNCCHNPIVYTLLHEKFRRILVSALACRRGHSVHPNHSLASPVSSRAPSHHASLKAALEKAHEQEENSPRVAVAIKEESSPVRDTDPCSRAKSPPAGSRLQVGSVVIK